MQYRMDQKSGKELSVLGFGCMRFPRGLTGTDLDKTERLLRSAIERGVNYFDTAYVYGGSEVALGECLSKIGGREKINIATKLPHGQCGGYEDFDRLFNEQLKRLKTDYIDYYLIHNVPEMAQWERVRAMGIEKWIAEKKAGGQIKQLGFSFHGAAGAFTALLEAYPWDFVQIQYNYLNENYQAGAAGLEKARQMGIPVIIMEPLLGGKLAAPPEKAVKIFQAADASRTPAEWAMRWLFDQPGVTCVLSGMNAMDQLDDNIAAADASASGPMTDAEKDAIAKVAAVIREAYKIPCTGCNYCMPCPKGVNIPEIFAAYNARAANGFVTGVAQYATSTALTSPGKNGSGRNCVKCGKCEKHCPQHIAIIKELETVTKKMEPLWVRAFLRLAFRRGVKKE